MSFHHQKLNNGLEIITESLPYVQSVSFAFFVRCGAVNEEPEMAGVSHFLEHMAFKGSENLSADDVNRRLDAIGANFNACTMEESTIYYASLLPEYFEQAVAVFAEILRPSCRDEDFESEKKVILEEIQMYEDSPPYGADELIRAEFFGDHPLGRSVLGTTASVSALQPDKMRRYFRERYSPEKIVFAACGKVDFPEIVRMVEKYCGAWEKFPSLGGVPEGRGGNSPPPEGWLRSSRGGRRCPQRNSNHPALTGTPPQEGNFTTPTLGDRKIIKPQAAQHYVLQTALAPSRNSPLRYAARILNSIVGDDSGSRLYWALVDDGRVEHALLSYAEFAEAGIFTTSLGCEPAEAEKNLKTLRKVYRKLEKHGVTADELHLARNRIATAVVLGNEKPWNRLFSFGSEWLERREYRTVREELELLRQVTLDDVHEVIRRYPLTKALTYCIGAE